MEERVGSKIRSNELETGLSSSDDPVDVEEDTTLQAKNELTPCDELID